MPSMKAAVSARLAEAGRETHGKPGGGAVAELEHAPGPAGHLGDGVVAKVVNELVEGGLHGGKCCEPGDERIAGGHRFLAENGVAVLVGHGPAHEVAVVVGECFAQAAPGRRGLGSRARARVA